MGGHEVTLVSAGIDPNRNLIDSHGRQYVIADIRSQIGHVSQHVGNAFAFGTLLYTIATGADHALMWIKNIKQGYDLVLSALIAGWDGGSTNFDKPAYVSVHTEPAEPTANATPVDIDSLNSRIGGNTSGSAEYKIWDTVGTGMTWTSTSGIIPSVIDKGMTNLDVNDSIIVGFQKTLGVSVTVPEAGKLSLIASAYFTEVDEGT